MHSRRKWTKLIWHNLPSPISISLTFYYVQFPAFANSKNYPHMRNFVVTERRRRSNNVLQKHSPNRRGDWVVRKSKRPKNVNISFFFNKTLLILNQPRYSPLCFLLPVAGWGLHVVGNDRVRDGPAAGSCPRVIWRRIKLLLGLPPSYCRRRRRNDRSAIAAIRGNVGNTLGLKEFLVICFVSPTAGTMGDERRWGKQLVRFFVWRALWLLVIKCQILILLRHFAKKFLVWILTQIQQQKKGTVYGFSKSGSETV